MGPLLRIVVFAAVAYAAENYLRRFLVAPPPPQAVNRANQVHDLAACSVCGTYISALSGPCGKPGCPQGVRQPG